MAVRELRRVLARPLYVVAEVVLPLLTLWFMTTVFGSGDMTRLSVGVVDYDFSAMSRNVVSTLRAVPALGVEHHYANEQQAREAVTRGEIYGFVVIPPHFESDVSMNRRTDLRYYYHYALMSVGGQLYAAFERTLQLVAAAPIATTGTALGVEERALESFVQPVTEAEYGPGNPTLNYGVYLIHPFYHVMLQVLILLVTIYAIGVELRDGTACKWVESSGGRVLRAVASKLLPHGVMFAAMALLGDWVIYQVVGVPRECALWQIMVSSLGLVASTMAVGVIIISVIPVLWFAVSLGSMFGSLGATLCGVTFPLRSMYGVFAAVAHVFPMMHFFGVSQLQVYGGLGIDYVWPHYVAYGAIVLVSLLCLPLLRRRVATTTNGGL